MQEVKTKSFTYITSKVTTIILWNIKKIIAGFTTNLVIIIVNAPYHFVRD